MNYCKTLSKEPTQKNKQRDKEGHLLPTQSDI